MMRLLWMICVLFSLSARAQVTVGEFLNSVFEEPILKSFEAQAEYLNNKSVYRLAPIQKLEFRTESNQLDRTRQDYGLRINPANPFEVKRTTQYFKTYQELLYLDRDRTLKELLYARYLVIIGWVYYQEILELKEEDKKTTEKLLAILEGQRFSGLFDAEDYMELKMEQVDKIIEVEETLFEIDNQKRSVDALYNGARLKSVSWPVSTLISLERLEVVVDSLFNLSARAGEAAYREKQIDLAKREWQLEKSNINMGFLQTEYQERRIAQNRRPWSISMGITIPVFNPNKGDMTKRKLEMLEAEGEFNAAKNDQLAGREINREKIKSLIKRYRDVQTMVQSLNVGAVAATLQQIKDTNPIAVVRMQNNLIKLKVMAARLRQEIYLGYLDFLSYAEVLQQQPVKNFLVNDLQIIAKP
ncbi:MAG TPA: hypothetical protein PLM56_11530 [Cyclobacteriaceae bacterium]|jgi:hypothetical protein|nr:hypothetical protein [Cyclobacteriaceae bacterium]HNT49582.1 hypothetical protein [Cyclobacteriaceae bacterium]HRE67247.1 hypothetical protein [Cyclobacteriaceae bacterium]HRF34121.1 hypothetical protein [Cyclobacteriaceae bacterium]